MTIKIKDYATDEWVDRELVVHLSTSPPYSNLSKEEYKRRLELETLAQLAVDLHEADYNGDESVLSFGIQCGVLHENFTDLEYVTNEEIEDIIDETCYRDKALRLYHTLYIEDSNWRPGQITRRSELKTLARIAVDMLRPDDPDDESVLSFGIEGPDDESVLSFGIAIDFLPPDFNRIDFLTLEEIEHIIDETGYRDEAMRIARSKKIYDHETNEWVPNVNFMNWADSK